MQPFIELPSDAQAALQRVPMRHREDAKQEGYLALLEDRCPRAAILNYWRQESLHERRELTMQAINRLPRIPAVLDRKYLVPSIMQKHTHDRMAETEPQPQDEVA